MSRLRIGLLAVRPRTLGASVVPVVVGTAVAATAGRLDPRRAGAALAVAVLLQIGANLLNDWGDCRRGADGPDRLGPVRVTQAGLARPGVVLGAGLGALALAGILGLPLAWSLGAPALLAGALAIAAAIAYTAGPLPLAYHGLGEVTVFCFFGPVAVLGTVAVQGAGPTALAWTASLPVGALATAILLVNNVRDADTDARAGKRTIVVRWGRRTGRRLYTGALALAFAAPAALALLAESPGPLLAWLAAPFAVPAARTMTRSVDGPALNAALAATARLHLAFGLLLAAGLVW